MIKLVFALIVMMGDRRSWPWRKRGKMKPGQMNLGSSVPCSEQTGLREGMTKAKATTSGKVSCQFRGRESGWFSFRSKSVGPGRIWRIGHTHRLYEGGSYGNLPDRQTVRENGWMRPCRVKC